MIEGVDYFHCKVVVDVLAIALVEKDDDLLEEISVDSVLEITVEAVDYLLEITEGYKIEIVRAVGDGLVFAVVD